MSLEAFHHSEPLTLGVELELQLVNTNDYDLAPYAEDMLRLMKKTPLPGSVVPEMTNSMIEISTGICRSSSEVLGQLSQIRDALVRSADKLNIAVVGAARTRFSNGMSGVSTTSHASRSFHSSTATCPNSSPSLASTCTLAAPAPTRPCSCCTA